MEVCPRCGGDLWAGDGVKRVDVSESGFEFSPAKEEGD